MAGGWKTGRARCFDKQIQAKQQTRRVLRPRSTRHRSFPLLHPSSQDFNSKSHPLSHIPSRSPHQNLRPPLLKRGRRLGVAPSRCILYSLSPIPDIPGRPTKKRGGGLSSLSCIHASTQQRKPVRPPRKDTEEVQDSVRPHTLPIPLFLCPSAAAAAPRPLA